MGCCMSSTNTDAPAASAPEKHVGSDKEASLNVKGFRLSYESRAQPPTVEEETVKEVLSETPKLKALPKQEPKFAAEMKQDLLEEEEETKIFRAHKVEAFGKIQEKQNLGSNEEIMSEGSEFCSVSISISESLSTVTDVVTDKRDNEEEEEQEMRQRGRVMSKSPAKPPFKRDRVMNRSSARRTIGNNGSAVKGSPGRRDPGENFRRRSRSPAAATRSSAAMGQSPSAGRANRSPGRVRSGPIENSTNGTRIKGKWWASGDDDNNNNENCGTNETLENPFVSLECFIFL